MTQDSNGLINQFISCRRACEFEGTLGGPMLRHVYAVVLFSAFFGFLLIATVPAIAQVDRGAIVGAVTDPTGARISNAQITITNRETSQPVHLRC